MIRRANNEDFDQIYEIINQAARAYQGVIPADRWTDPYMTREELAREISHGVEFWGYAQDDLLIGVMGMQQVQDVTLIRHAYTRTSNQKSGVGAQLLAHLETLTTRPILIGTWKDATWAVRFYERRGYTLTTDEEKNLLLKKYWNIPDRQVETSVVLRSGHR
jgi:N-acetylglutamate synthase-like GNAT family acetyltransferase